MSLHYRISCAQIILKSDERHPSESYDPLGAKGLSVTIPSPIVRPERACRRTLTHFACVLLSVCFLPN